MHHPIPLQPNLKGGQSKMSRVGHAFIKQQMREEDAVFAGELSAIIASATTITRRVRPWQRSVWQTW